MRPLPSRLVGLLLALVTAVALTACSSGDDGGDGGSTSGDSADSASEETTGERTDVGDGEALRWGDGGYGVVLAHGAAFDAASWEEQATAIADQGATVLAVEDIEPDAIAAAVEQLQSEGIEDVALVGGSAGADAILELASEQPDLPAALVLLAPNSFVDGLGEQPILFITSEDDPVAEVTFELEDAAPGEEKQILMPPGDAHAQNIFDGNQSKAATDAILQFLDQFLGEQ